MNKQQIKFIEDHLKDLGFSDEKIMELISNFNEIAQPLSKQSTRNPSTKTQTVLDSFFENIRANYRRNPTQKRDVFSYGSERICDLNENKCDTDSEDDD